jgi:phosphoribosylamine---glycine ligase
VSPLFAPTRILVVGGGGREHALAWKLAGEPGINEVIVAPGSRAIGREPRVRCRPEVDQLDPGAVVRAARAEAAELVVVGPEAPLAAGVADALIEAGIPVFGPTRAAARLETSKAFCHEVAAAAGVRMARARSFAADQLEAARSFAAELAATGDGLVVKADGLAAGKGVAVCDDLAAAEAILPGHFGARAADEPADAVRVVLEERLRGPEASLIALTDGRLALALPPARDYKRLGDGDRGPNTGGMGAYSPVPDVDEALALEILDAVHRPILVEMAQRGTPFGGFLYAGLILTETGPALLECNVRLGDPEAQVMLPRLAGPLGRVLAAAAAGDLGGVAAALGRGVSALPVRPGATVGIVLAAAGYPGTPQRGHAISGLEAAAASGALVFHAGTLPDAGGGARTNGGRVLTVVGEGPDLATARDAAERAAGAITWPGLQRRHDIGLDAPVAAGGSIPAGAAR